MDNDDRDVRYLHVVGTANRQEQAEKEDGPPAPPAPNEASKAPTLFADRHSRNEPIPLAQRVLQIHWSKESDITNAMSALSVSTGSRFSGMTSHRSNSSLTTKRSLLSRSGRTISLDSMRWDSTNSRELYRQHRANEKNMQSAVLQDNVNGTSMTVESAALSLANLSISFFVSMLTRSFLKELRDT